MPELHIDTTHPVLVTGATGYVAGRVVERLLQEGLTVHATVRDPSNTERLAYLTALADANPGTLQLYAGDLTKPGSFAEAMAGCRVVFHIASPFTSDFTDPQKELVDPAVGGTRNVLEEANRTGSVERVVVTSSCAAIYGDNADLEDTPSGVFTEEVWNTSSSLTDGAYSYSKTCAEREAWNIHDAQSRWKLVVVNPCLVMGPGVKVHTGSESFSICKQLGDGSFAPMVPDIGMGIVDVRDLAEAHLCAGFVPDAEGRHIIAGHDSSFGELAAVLRPKWSDRFAIPSRALPSWMKPVLWLVGPWVNSALTRRYISRNVDLPWKSDNSKSIEKLGMRYRPLEETMNDFFAQLVEAGEIQTR